MYWKCSCNDDNFFTSLHAQNGTRYLSKVFPAKFKSSILRMSMRSGWFPTLRLIQTDCIKFRCRCNFQHEFPYSSMSVFSPGCFWSWSTQIFYLDKDATFCRDVVPCCKANADAVQVWWFDSCIDFYWVSRLSGKLRHLLSKLSLWLQKQNI